MTPEETTNTPLEQPAMTETYRRKITIGLPCGTDPGERRFPLTPEGVAILVERGFEVLIEHEASQTIQYPTQRYVNMGARMCPRSQVMSANIVISLSMPTPADIMMMHRGAMLLTLSPAVMKNTEALKALLQQNIITIAIDLIKDTAGHTPFADVLAEIDGLAAMARATAMMSDSVNGKGMLLGGVPGIVPCEVTIIGSSIAGCAAARAAMGAGALVRMFDNDIYMLRRASEQLNGSIVFSAIYPGVLENALRSADVVIYAGVTPQIVIDTDMVRRMKQGVIVFDLTSDPGKAFQGIDYYNLTLDGPRNSNPLTPQRACYFNISGTVARTAAMALSNTFTTMLNDIVECDGTMGALRLLPGLQCAALTFLGKPVNKQVAQLLGQRHADINIYLALS